MPSVDVFWPRSPHPGNLDFEYLGRLAKITKIFPNGDLPSLGILAHRTSEDDSWGVQSPPKRKIFGCFQNTGTPKWMVYNAKPYFKN